MLRWDMAKSVHLLAGTPRFLAENRLKLALARGALDGPLNSIDGQIFQGTSRDRCSVVDDRDALDFDQAIKRHSGHGDGAPGWRRFEKLTVDLVHSRPVRHVR